MFGKFPAQNRAVSAREQTALKVRQSDERDPMSTDKLQAELLRNDPRVAEARSLLRAALSDHRASLSGPQPPHPSLQADYAQLIEQFSRDRGGGLFYPYLGSGLGNGALVELADGSVKYDMITGIGVHAFGHSDSGFLDAVLDAALQDTVMQGNLQQNVDSAVLCQKFVDIGTEGGAHLEHCFLSTSGATANENALKILFQAKHPANRMLAFGNCFAGRTLATSQLTDRAKNRVGLPTVMAVDYVPFYDMRTPETSTRNSVSRLAEHLERYPHLHAGMIMELIQGEGGYYTAPPSFFVALCELLREHHIPIWFDEIQSFGRTTRPFAFQHYALDRFADVVTVGKMTQVCATLFRDELTPKPGLVSQTFTGATSAITTSVSILERLRTGDFFGESGRLMQIHQRFVDHFERMYIAHPDRISGPWGFGGMVAFTVSDGSAEKSKRFLDTLFDVGVLAFFAGGNPTRIRMLPPFGVISDEQIDHVCALIEEALNRVCG